jgi:hypothetical protein
MTCASSAAASPGDVEPAARPVVVEVMHRRRFLRSSGLTLLVVPFGTFLVQGCYADSGDAPAAPPAVSGSNVVYTSSIDDDHSHTFALALAALTSPVDTRGETSIDDDHAHTVAISAAQLQSAQRGDIVKVTTGSSESHTHVLTLVKLG